VLVIGDSLEVGSGPYVRQQLTGTPVSVDARTGRPSSEGVAVLRQRLTPADRVVVFDLGVAYAWWTLCISTARSAGHALAAFP
jgi:hypothetical protein